MINQLFKKNKLRFHLVSWLFLLSLVTFGQGSVSLSFSHDNCASPPQAGTYSPSGTQNGKVRYVKDGTHSIYWTGSRWEIISGGTVTHYNNTNSSKLPCSNWSSTFGCFLPNISGDCASPPTSSDIPGVSVDEGAADVIINLQNYFNDAQDGSAGLTYTKRSTDGSFFAATINSSNQLIIDFAETGAGESTVTIRATDSDGAYVEESFTVKARVFIEGSVLIDFEDLGFSHNSDYGSGVYVEGNFKISYPTMNWYESQNGEGGTYGLMANGEENAGTDITIETVDGSEVDFISFYTGDPYGDGLPSIKGYKDGVLIGTQSFVGSGTVTLSDATFDQVDKIVITSTTWGYWEQVFDNFWYLPLQSSSAPTVTTASVSTVGQSDATLGGIVTSDGGAAVTERGVVYNTTGNPTTSDTKVQIGMGTGSFSQSISGFSEATQYFVRAYAINSVGTGYGSEETFTTLSGGCAPTTGITTFDGTNVNIAPYGTLPKSGVVDCWEITTTGGGSGSINHNGANSPSNVNMFVGSASSISIKSQDGSEFDLGSFTAQWFSFAGNYTISAYRDGGMIGSTTGTASSTYTQVDVSANSDFGNIDEFVFTGFGGSNVTINLDQISIGPANTTTTLDPYSSLYWPNNEGKKIEGISDSGTDRQDILSDPSLDIIAIDVDLTNEKVYWFDQGTYKIHRANLDGTGSEVFVSNPGYATTIFIDQKNGYLYWPNYEASKIERIGLDGTGRQDIIIATDPIGIAVDVNGSKVYWFDQTNYQIYRGNLDGSGSEAFVSNPGYATTLYFDQTNGYLYWPNNEAGKIERIKSDGTGRTDVITATDPIGITVDASNSKVYWFDQTNYKIYRGNLDGTGAEVFIADPGYATTLVVPSMPPAGNLPTVSTTAESNITDIGATLNGEVTSDGGAAISERGFVYSTISPVTIGDGHSTQLSDGGGTGIFSEEITGLNPGTTYYVRAYATNAVGTAYGIEETFTTYESPLALVYNTTLSSGTDIQLPLGTSGSANVTVDWGDGLTDTYTSTGIKTHTYASEGTYTVKVYGNLDHFGYGPDYVSSINNDKLTNITDFGNLGITDLSGAARGASNLSTVPTSLPADVTDLRNMFRDAGSFSQDLNGWDVSKVENMAAMFWGASNFNGNISSWSTGAVTSMNSMFLSAGSFDQDISGWNTSQVTDMGQMFLSASSFSQDIGGWDVSNVSNMMSMFLGVSNFNFDLSNWNTQNVKYMQNMFLAAGSFNQDLNSWNVSNVENMSRMFENSAIDQKFDGWDVSRVSNMSDMFKNETLSTANYDATLTAWSMLPLQNGVTFNAGNSEYSPGTAETARQKIIDDFGWTIIDGGLNVPAVTLSQTETTFDEKGGTNTVTVTLSETYGENVSVTLGIKSSGTATPDTDFTLSSTTVEVLAGETTGSVTLSGVDDAINESNESVIVEIVSITNGVEDGIQEVSSVIHDDEITEANAGADQDVCGTNAVLIANGPEAVGETGSWSIISGAGGTIDSPTDIPTEFSGISGTIYTLRWTIQDGVAEDSFDDVTITFFDNPTVAAAGPDKNVEGAIFTTTLEANSASGFQENGTWAEISGDGNGSFTDVNDPVTTFSGTPGVNYTLRWSISNGVCPVSSDDVVVTFINTAGFTVVESDGESLVHESGSTDQFTVVLDAKPASDVTLSVTSGDEGEVVADVATLTFTSTDWNTPQTVTLSGVDDIRVDGNVLTNITVSVADDQSDDAYDAVPDQIIEVANGDDDTAALTIADVSGNEDDGAITVTATLDNAVDGGFTIDVSTTDGTAAAGTDYTAVSNETLTFAGAAGETQVFTMTPTVDSEAEDAETLTVSMSNLGGTALNVSTTDEAMITITNDDHAPVFTSAVAVEVLENLKSVQDVAATDSDSGETLTYSVSGGADESRFSIDVATGALSFVDAPDYENAADADKNNVYDVQVTASDGTNSTDQVISVTVKDVNDNSPVFTSTDAADVDEHTTALLTVTATDADAGTSISFSLTGGDDQSKFSINSSTGELIFADAPDHENATDANGDNDYLVTVRASDGTNHTDQIITVFVQDVNDNSPVITSANSVSIDENNTAVMMVTATDADATSMVTYDITGGLDQGLFSINNTSGELTFVSAPDAENASDSDKDNEYLVEVTATDGLHTDVQTITIAVTDVDDNAPVISGTFTGEVAEGFAEEVVTVDGTISISDADINDTPVFTAIDGVAGDNKYGTFSLTGTTWTFTLDHAAVEQLDAIDQVTDSIVLSASDGSTQKITITITGKDPDNDRDDISDYVDADDDNDGTLDVDDAFPLDPSEDTDTDGDGTGNNADTDDDNDGTLDTEDAFPLDPSEDTDTDGDGTGNNADTDDDNDGTTDVDDAFPLDPSEDTDTDGDGTGNNADTDDDNDGTLDTEDAFPLDPSEDIDTDGDGTGNNADTDDDNDGTPDTEDAFPIDPQEDTDTDGDGIGNNADDNDDNDPFPDHEDEFPLIPSGTSDMDGDGIPDSDEGLTDTDNDGIPNYLDEDSDDDEIADVDEGVEDCDKDGIPDYLDPYSCQDLMTRKILTANNDGYNDQFVIKGIDKFPDNQVIIYNRWGAVVWEIEHYDNEDPEKSFMGISNKIGSSQRLPGGTYFYVIIRGGEKTQKGYFVLN